MVYCPVTRVPGCTGLGGWWSTRQAVRPVTYWGALAAVSSLGAGSLQGSSPGHRRRRHLSGRHRVFPRSSLLAPPPPVLLAPLFPSSCPSFSSSSCCSSFSSSSGRPAVVWVSLPAPLRASPSLPAPPRFEGEPSGMRAQGFVALDSRDPKPDGAGPTILFRAPGRERSPEQRGAWAACGDRGRPPPRPGPGMGGLVGRGRAVAWPPKAWEADGPPDASLASLSGVSLRGSFVHWVGMGPSCPQISSVLGKAAGACGTFQPGAPAALKFCLSPCPGPLAVFPC